MATDDDSDVPETGGVFTFGKSKFADNVPSKFWVRNDQVVQVACGDEHTALVTESGRIFTFGVNDWSQLGLGDTKTRTKPCCVKSLKPEKVRSVACGRSSTYVATESGKVYSFGGNTENQLGLGVDDTVVAKPALIRCDELDGTEAKMISAGADHAAILSSDGRVFIWGGNSSGQLGLGNVDEAKSPTFLDMDEEVTCISCGYYHTALTTASGDLYTFGESDDGKLGLGEDPKKTNVPRKVSGIEGKVMWVACGGSHTVAITSNGKVYTFGDGSNGQLGHGNIQLQATQPQEMTSLRESRIKWAACGENHTALISDRGVLFSCGDGRHGKLALGEENFANQFKPSPCTRFGSFAVEKVACGGCHMIVLAKPKLHNGTGLGSGSDKEASDEAEHNSQPGRHSMIEALRKSEDLSLSGSFSARNRRREKQDSQTGNSLSRTLPPLNSSLSAARTLPPLGSSDAGGEDNPLNRSMLPPVRKPENDRKKIEDEEENREKRDKEESPKPWRKVEVKESLEVKDSSRDFGEDLESMPVPLPRGNLRLSPVPSPRRLKPVAENQRNSSESEEDSGEPRRKPVRPSRVSEAKSSPVPRPRLDRRRFDRKGSEEESDEESDRNHKKEKEGKKADKFSSKKQLADSERSESEEDESDDRNQSKKGVSKYKKKDRYAEEEESNDEAKKRGGPFGRRKLLDSEEEEEEEDTDDDDSEESLKDKRKKVNVKKDKKKGKDVGKVGNKKKDKKKASRTKDSEESEDEPSRNDGKRNKKSKNKSESDDEDDRKEDIITDDDEEKEKDDKEEKKPPEKKSKLCIIL